MTRRVLFYVQHLLGIGHMKRAAAVARALAARDDLRVDLVVGGPQVPSLDFGRATVHRLPPVQAADAAFSALVDAATGAPLDDALKARRRDRLLALFRDLVPDVVITEMFPFGRRQFRFELLPLLEAARARSPRPVILSSVRDVLVTKDKPGRTEEMLGWAQAFYDRVLVHGDPKVIAFDETFPAARACAGLLAYTGYVVDPPVPPPADAGGVVVSVGGGAVGTGLLRLALAARPLSRLKDLDWLLLTGPNLPDTEAAFLRNRAGGGVRVETFRPDLPGLLAGCRVSVSQAGYNTVLDGLAAGASMVVQPFADGAETEQAFRARRFAERGLLRVLSAGETSPKSVAEAIDAASEMSPTVEKGIDLNGAATSAALVAALATGGDGGT
ncbi:MAG: glycosyltransferase [Rhodobacterales bacterium]|nr:glycosyltransferase [Rhodobacterales bacterium]